MAPKPWSGPGQTLQLLLKKLGIQNYGKIYSMILIKIKGFSFQSEKRQTPDWFLWPVRSELGAGQVVMSHR
jgi:hypothetical protein